MKNLFMINTLMRKIQGDFRVYKLLIAMLFSLGVSATMHISEPLAVSTASFSELFTYPSTISYKAGSNTVVTPTIAVVGGVFVAKRITPGPGMISLDEQSGQINLRKSDPGRYSITYTVNGQTQTISIVIS
jgi:hypothetical protein